MAKKKKIIHTLLNSSNAGSNFSAMTPKQKRQFKNSIRKKNPCLFHFNVDNSFIYEPLYSNFFYNKLTDKNTMKFNNSEIIFLENLLKNSYTSKASSIVYVSPFFKQVLQCLVPCKIILSERASIINNILINYKEPSQISINKVTEKYNEFALSNNKKPLHKTSIYNIIKNVLKYSYRKSNIKTNKLETKEYIKYCFFFIKCLIRCLKMGINPIYIDETCFK